MKFEKAFLDGLVGAVRDRSGATADGFLRSLGIDAGDPLFCLIRDGKNLQHRVLGAQAAISQLRVRGELVVAGKLACGLWDWLSEGGEIHRDLSFHPIATNLAMVAAACLNDAGCGSEVIRRSEPWLIWVREAGDSEQVIAMELMVAEAGIQTGAYHVSDDLLKALVSREPAVKDNAVFSRLSNKMDSLYRAADRFESPKVTFQEILEQTWLQLMGCPMPVQAGQPDSQSLQAFKISLEQSGFPGPIADLGKVEEIVSGLQDNGSPLFQLNELIHYMNGYLESVKASGNPEPELFRLAKLASRAEASSRNLGLWEESQTLGWIQAVALYRAEAYADCAAVLKDLRTWCRRRQMDIPSPMLRAALAEHLPHLPVLEAQALAKRAPGSREELFGSIEACKSAILGEMVAGKFGPGRHLQPLAPLRNLLMGGRHRAAYLTMLVDDEVTHVVLLDPRGELHSTELPMRKSVLTAAVQELGRLNEGNPSSWKHIRKINPENPWERSYADLLESLAPLGTWIEGMMVAGHLQERDYLCISPDGPLYNLPLQAVAVSGRPLGIRLGCSIVPSARILLFGADMRADGPPGRAASCVVPLEAESRDDSYGILDRLEAGWRHVFLGGPEADIERLRKAPLSGSHVYIGAHGTFDRKDPLHSSGILLARQGSLPSGKGDPASARLSPDALGRLDLRSSHLVLRSCVTGRTTEITSREALGMVWAAFESGAASLMAGQWHIYIPTAEEILEGFYAGVAGGSSLLEAYRSAMERMYSKGGIHSHPYHYAGMAFFGFWE